MLSYETAVKLREAGFEQTSSIKVHPEKGISFCLSTRDTAPDYWIKNGWVCSPTLSELIEACGEHFCELSKSISDHDYGSFQIVGEIKKYRDYYMSGFKSPEEVVAALWLAINKKTI